MELTETVSISEQYLQTWIEARTRFSNLLAEVSEVDLKKKLHGVPNSAGFIIRHIADVELLFARNVFGGKELKVHARTVIAQKDTGVWTNLKELRDYSDLAFETLKQIIYNQQDEDWTRFITTKEFGTKTISESLGRVISHTAYHAGQLALILKYGNVANNY